MIGGKAAPRPHDSAKREFAVFLRAIVSFSIAIMLVRFFLIELSHVPTGSMAPHRLGDHVPYVCPDCDFGFAAGFAPDGIAVKPICPNCGSRRIDSANHSQAQAGDRLWISRAAWNFSAPARWDEVVFYAPGSTLTPHLKRIAGLPGEKVRIEDGDIFADGYRVRLQAARVWEERIYHPVVIKKRLHCYHGT